MGSRFDLWSRIPILLLDKFSEIRIFEEGEQNGRAKFFQGEKNVGFPIRSLVENSHFTIR